MTLVCRILRLEAISSTTKALKHEFDLLHGHARSVWKEQVALIANMKTVGRIMGLEASNTRGYIIALGPPTVSQQFAGSH